MQYINLKNIFIFLLDVTTCVADPVFGLERVTVDAGYKKI